MKQVTAWFILAAPILILAVDVWVYFRFGPDDTITGVVRDWSKESWLPEAVFLAGCLLLWLHLFRGLPWESEVSGGR